MGKHDWSHVATRDIENHEHEVMSTSSYFVRDEPSMRVATSQNEAPPRTPGDHIGRLERLAHICQAVILAET